MRKKAIINDFRNRPYPGSLVMDETNNFMCSILMDIDDEIRITYNYNSEDLLNLHQNTLEMFSDISYDNLKRDNITYKIDENQSSFDNDKNTSWIFNLDAKNLLREYLYNEIYTINNQSPFRKIPENIISSEQISDLCYDYIDKNVLNKYELSEFVLWTKYYDLNLNTVPGTGTGTGIVGELNERIDILQKTPKFTFFAIPTKTQNNIDIINPDIHKESINIKKTIDDCYDISYKQTKSSQYTTFIFYYDVIFKRK